METLRLVARLVDRREVQEASRLRLVVDLETAHLARRLLLRRHLVERTPVGLVAKVGAVTLELLHYSRWDRRTVMMVLREVAQLVAMSAAERPMTWLACATARVLLQYQLAAQTPQVAEVGAFLPQRRAQPLVPHACRLPAA